MENFLYVAAFVLVVFWVIGFIGFNVGGLIHILLFLALISILLRIIKGKKSI